MMTTTVKIASNASFVFDKTITLGKPKPRPKAHYRNIQIVGLKQRHLMKKEATPKRKGLKTNTSNEKRGNPKCQGLKTKISNEKGGNTKMQGA
jgi:hypothetical protein